MAELKTQDCSEWLKGKCTKGDKCFSRHTANKKGSTARASTVAGSEDLATDPAETPVVQGRQQVAEQGQIGNPCPFVTTLATMFVTTRPTAFADLERNANVQLRRQTPNDEVYDFNSFKHLLPVVKQPPPGYCHASKMHPYNLPDVSLRVIWVTGAEGTSISPQAASRIMRGQELAGFIARECPLNGMSRMDPPQRFYSYAEAHGRGEGRIVDILGYLRMMTPEGDVLPPLDVRIVDGQIDDILVSAPHTDFLGWDRNADPNCFLLHTVGCSVLRPLMCARQKLNA